MFFAGQKIKKNSKQIIFKQDNFFNWGVLVRKNPLNYLRFAAFLAAKTKCKNKGFYIGAVGVRNDGAQVHAFNGSANHPIASAHAETRLSQKLDVGSIVYVARYSFGTHNLVMAKPCMNCQRVLQSCGVKKIYYSIQDNEYGIMVF